MIIRIVTQQKPTVVPCELFGDPYLRIESIQSEENHQSQQYRNDADKLMRIRHWIHEIRDDTRRWLQSWQLSQHMELIWRYFLESAHPVQRALF